MSFDDKLYNELIKWADGLLTTRNIQNFTAIDLINQAYIDIASNGELFNRENARKAAQRIFYNESNLTSRNDRNYLDFGQSNPNYKTIIPLDQDRVCKLCHDLKPIMEFRVIKDKTEYHRTCSYCRNCENILNEQRRHNPNRKIGVNNVCRYNVYNEYGELLLVAKSMVDLILKTGYRKYVIRKVLKGKRHKNIHRYVKEMQ